MNKNNLRKKEDNNTHSKMNKLTCPPPLNIKIILKKLDKNKQENNYLKK